MGCICWTDLHQWPSTFFFLPVLIIPFIIGLLDDLFHLKPLAKLVAQWITASLIFFILDIRLISFYGFAAYDDFSPVVSYLVTLFTVIIITNSLNLIDGIDGLAAVFSFIAGLVFGSWFLFAGIYQYAIICFSLCGAILAFLFQNWEPSKIFMGDTGSLVIGTILSVIMIQFINENHMLEPGHKLKFNSSIGTAIAIMIIPLVDTSRIIIVRLYKNISPFTPDKRHIHHALVRLNLSHKQAVYILTLAHLAFIGIAILMRKTSDWSLLGFITVFAVLLCIILDKKLKNYLRSEAGINSESFH